MLGGIKLQMRLEGKILGHIYRVWQNKVAP